jgi:hypothetical protein
MPTPVRNPTSTVRDKKLARKPRRATRATKRNAPASRALNPANATHSGVLGWSPEMPRPAIPANMIAAVAESPPTTRCRDDPNSAYAVMGIRIV